MCILREMCSLDTHIQSSCGAAGYVDVCVRELALWLSTAAKVLEVLLRMTCNAVYVYTCRPVLCLGTALIWERRQRESCAFRVT